jgi:hypothetical protein
MYFLVTWAIHHWRASSRLSAAAWEGAFFLRPFHFARFLCQPITDIADSALFLSFSVLFIRQCHNLNDCDLQVCFICLPVIFNIKQHSSVSGSLCKPASLNSVPPVSVEKSRKDMHSKKPTTFLVFKALKFRHVYGTKILLTQR